MTSLLARASSVRSTVALGVLVLLTLLGVVGVVSWRTPGASSATAASGGPACSARIFRARSFFTPRRNNYCQFGWSVTSGDLTTPLPAADAASPRCHSYVDRRALRHELCAYSADGHTYTRFDFRTVPGACAQHRGPLDAGLLRRPVLIADCELGGRQVRAPNGVGVSVPRHDGSTCAIADGTTGSSEVCVTRDRFAVSATVRIDESGVIRQQR